VRQEAWDPTCSERREGFRPQRKAHQAVEQAQASIREGDTWVVDIDLEKSFDRVHHDVLMSRVRRRVQARRVVTLIHRFLKAGVLIREGSIEPTAEGTPHGGRLSPQLATLRLDELDKEREKRGHRFARYADEAKLSGRSRQAGERVMASVTRCLERTRRLTVNEAKSAVDRPWNRTGLGCPCTTRPCNRRNGSEKVLTAFQAKVRALTGRTRGRTIRCATWTRGCGGGSGAPTASHGVGGDLGSGERAAWAGNWPGPRPSPPTSVASAAEPRVGDCAATALLRRARPAEPGRRLIPPLHPPNRRRRDPYVRWCGRAGAARFPPIPIRLLHEGVGFYVL
jgi:Reverse transcriptase (RNA-dependent DNA polymerase)